MLVRRLRPARAGLNHGRPAGLNQDARPRWRPLLVLSIVLRHLTGGPAHAVRVGWRLVPRTLRRHAVRRLTPVAPTLAAIGLHTLGRRAAARTQLREHAASGRRRGRVVAAAVACGELELAREVGGRGVDLPDLTRARLLRAEGRLGDAAALAGRTASPTGRMLRAQVLGELRSLDPQRRLAAEATRAPGRHPGGHPGARSPALRVLHVVSNALPEVQAGYTLRTAGMVRAQQAAGLDPHVVTRLGYPVDTGHARAARLVVVDGVPHHRLLPTAVPVGTDRHLDLAQRELTALVADLRPDVIHAHSKHENGQVALAVGAELGVPVVYEVRGMLEETWRSRGGDTDTDYYRMTREAETWCMRRAARTLTLSSVMAADIGRRGVPADRVAVTGNAVGPEFLGVPERRGARARLGLTAQELVLGVVSTLNDYEGVDVLVRALAGSGVEDARLVVVGDGPARIELEELAAALGARVRFTGRVPHSLVPELLAAMDVFCVPRLPTPVTSLVSPLKPFEAMGAGLPLLVSDLPALAELLHEGRHGWTSAPGDVGAWTSSLQALAGDRAALAVRGRAAAAWVGAERTWDRVAEQHVRIYLEVVDEHDAGAGASTRG